MQTTIEVSDATPLLTTDRAEIATTLTGGQVQELPVLDRNITNLLLEIPGTHLNTWAHSAAENPEQGIQANVNGQFFTANGFLLDGTENESAILGIAVINPNIDALQEFKVSTSNFDAEFGAASGALIQATTKSGTNHYTARSSSSCGTMSPTPPTPSPKSILHCVGISMAALSARPS